MIIKLSKLTSSENPCWRPIFCFSGFGVWLYFCSAVVPQYQRTHRGGFLFKRAPPFWGNKEAETYKRFHGNIKMLVEGTTHRPTRSCIIMTMIDENILGRLQGQCGPCLYSYITTKRHWQLVTARNCSI